MDGINIILSEFLLPIIKHLLILKLGGNKYVGCGIFGAYILFFFGGVTNRKIDTKDHYDFSVPVYIETREDPEKMGGNIFNPVSNYFKITSIINGEFQSLRLVNRVTMKKQKHALIEKVFLNAEYFEDFYDEYGYVFDITETEFNKKLEEVKKD